MLRTFAAGRLGQDAKHTTTQGGTDICRFSLATDVGYGENKQTIWLDVSKFGKGAEGLARILRKGSAVAVTGELSTREYEGKTYLQCKADDVTILNTPGDGRGERKQSYDSGNQGGGWGNDGQADGYAPF